MKDRKAFNLMQTGRVERLLIVGQTEAEDVGFVGGDLIDDGAQFSVPERCDASRIAADDDKVIGDCHTPHQRFLFIGKIQNLEKL